MTQLDGTQLADRVRLMIHAWTSIAAFRHGTFGTAPDVGGPAVFASMWTHEKHVLLSLHNLGNRRERVLFNSIVPVNGCWERVLGAEGIDLRNVDQGVVELPAYGFCWLRC